MNHKMFPSKARTAQDRWFVCCLSILCLGILSTGCSNAITIGGGSEFTFPKNDGSTGSTTDDTTTPEIRPPHPDQLQPPPDRTQPPPDRTQPPPDRTQPPPDRTQPPPDRRLPGCPGTCKPGQRRNCYTGPAPTLGKGLCKAGVQICDTQCNWGGCLGEVKPAAEACDTLDNDCDGKIDETFPGAGKTCKVGARPGVCGTGKTVCQKGKLVCATEPIGPEVCDGKDNNCDGKVDNIPDSGKACTVPGGQGACGTGLWACRGNRKTCIPRSGTTEVCDGKDNDCNGKIDEKDPRMGRACSISSKKGLCRAGTYKTCTKGVLVCVSNSPATPEKCDGLDNDCDGLVDNNVGAVCYTGPAKNRGVGACLTGRISCVNGKLGPCRGSVLPSTEKCDSLDNDCDGSVDEGNVCVKPGRGPAFRINSFSIAGGGVGFDLNGDGKKDNSLSVIGSFVNSTLQQSIRSGVVNIILELASLSDPKAQSGTATVYLYTGRAGTGGYSIEKTSLDSSGKPLFRFAAKIASGLLTGGPGRAVLSLPLIGSATLLRLESAYIQFRIAKNLQSLTNGLLAGALPSINLELIPAVGIPVFGGPGKTVLDVLVQLGKQPDVDLDRDGLETFQSTVAGGITVCIDGNKTTKITGGTCARDKRIADGFSVTFSFTATRTKILGTAP